MSFEQIYEKYLNGTATEEEKLYIEEEIAKARKLAEIMDKKQLEDPVVEQADTELVKSARKKFSKRATISGVIIVFAVMIVVTAIVLGSIFGVAVSGAKKQQQYSIEEAKQFAIEFCDNNYSTDKITGLSSQFFVDEANAELVMTKTLKNSYYKYVIELKNGIVEIEVEVDSRTSLIKVVDIDY